VTAFWFDLGDVAVVPVVENPRLLIAPGEFFPRRDVDGGHWCFREPWFDAAASRLVFVIQSFLVVTPDRIVLVDACVGAGKRRARAEFDALDPGWLATLQATGVTPSDITSVVLTHLHVDHVGWATRDRGGGWLPVFPDARHHVTAAEYAYWASPAGATAMLRTGDYMADSVRPLADHGLLELVPADAAICPGVRLVPAFGHTPGNVAVRVTGSGGEIMLVGDVLHHPVQLLHPELSTRYCVRPREAVQTRRRLLDEAAASGTPVLPAHFAHPSAGRVVASGAGYAFRPASDILRRGQYRLRRREP
jgi:glyoxylase-like metal-dependent hydrolase (beta-lactamase superfamily II)